MESKAIRPATLFSAKLLVFLRDEEEGDNSVAGEDWNPKGHADASTSGGESLFGVRVKVSDEVEILPFCQERKALKVK